MVSYVDARVGELLSELRRLGLRDSTLVVFASDHGDMLGEHGMWFKRTFHEWSVRVPFMVAGPGVKPRRAGEVISLIDLLPTLLELIELPIPHEGIHGSSFARALQGPMEGWKDTALVEYCGEGTLKPLRAIRQGRFKYVYVPGLRPLLFDLEADPYEETNLAGCADHRETEDSLRAQLLTDWDPRAVEERVLRSQAERLFLHKALTTGSRYRWDYVPSSVRLTVD
jgi:choline-sulfatase